MSPQGEVGFGSVTPNWSGGVIIPGLGHRPGQVVIVIWPTAAVIGSNFSCHRPIPRRVGRNSTVMPLSQELVGDIYRLSDDCQMLGSCSLVVTVTSSTKSP